MIFYNPQGEVRMNCIRWRRGLPLVCAGFFLAAASVAAATNSTPARTGAGGSSEVHQNDRFRSARALIEKLVSEDRIPSVTVAVAKDGKILWEEGFGWADRERRIPAAPHTPYSIASVTKPITSTAIMALSERGKINLDAPIENYLGRVELTGFAGDTRGVTPRRIMAHSAGLPMHYYFYHGGYLPPNPEETITRYGIVVYPPGKEFQYSNMGYRTLDVAISNVSDQSYGEFLRREIFLPLGMTRSAVGRDPSWASEAAARYDFSQNPIPFYMST